MVYYVHEVLAEYDGAGNLLAEYVSANGQRIAKINPTGTVDLYLNDHLGSARAMVGSGWSANYYPFGEIASQTGSDEDTRYDFTGKERDRATNLMYFGARYYDPEIGRWVSVDPSAANYPGWSPYNYAADNPLIIIDPDGRDWYNLGSDRNPNIRWVEGSDLVAKPGIFNSFLRLIGAGGYATSLGADVLVIRGRTENEQVNEAVFEIYSHTNTAEPVATAFGNTIPASPKQEDPTVYRTLATGFYTDTFLIENYHGSGIAAIGLNGEVPATNGEMMTLVRVHRGNVFGLTRRDSRGTPWSQGCPTFCYGQNMRNTARQFASHFTNSMNVYLIRN